MSRFMKYLRYTTRVILVLVLSAIPIAIVVTMWSAVWRIGLALLCMFIVLAIFWNTWDWAWKSQGKKS